eukprot:CAMPEP_0114322952 /NCGR_PEP_ID=MMETSP0059-20121206/27567_1 /TAXON_ID=36894 /ORGANISM="Pyramimonas parkeae, Strain CCMP726" /LENGTH=37 /DNA_ID= /DNA_START= /DNA_END= /DNA_ORIENTATION=
MGIPNSCVARVVGLVGISIGAEVGAFVDVFARDDSML